MENHADYSPWLHRTARLTAGATFLLIVIGAIVTSTDSGLAVPDWPTTFGYNMFLYPLSEMVGGILYEHSHRLMGSLVGILTIGLFVLILAKDSRKWLKWLGLAALIAVIVQGVLGGLRVTQMNRNFAIVHACLAQAFFALLCGIAWFTSQDWRQDIRTTTGETARKLRRLSLMTTCFIYVQLIFGAILRHTGSRLDAHLLFAFLVALHIFLLARRLLGTNGDAQKNWAINAAIIARAACCSVDARHWGVFRETDCIRRNIRSSTHGHNYHRTRCCRCTHAGEQFCAYPENLPIH